MGSFLPSWVFIGKNLTWDKLRKIHLNLKIKLT
jgi:hypothetical protein